MPAQLIDGVKLSQQLRADIAARTATLTAAGHKPGLAVIIVGDDPASHVYVRNKVKACGDVGFHSVLERYEADFSEQALLERIAALNADPAIHGILVQMPLPRHIDPSKVIEAIATSKDVDGYSVLSAGELMTGLEGFRPCTPYGCMKLIETTGVDLRGKHAVVIVRSNAVGKPMALLVLQANATVTICDIATRDRVVYTRESDVMVADVGGRNTQALCLFVDDADAHCAQARAHGATIFSEPATHDYGDDYWSDRSYGAADLEGHAWWFMHRLRDRPAAS